MIFEHFVYKNVSQKKLFLYINENYIHWHYRKTKCTFLYTQKTKKLPNDFIHKKLDTFQKTRQFLLRTFPTGFFMKFLSCHLYTKSMTLSVTWRFYIQTSIHFAKTKTICVLFLYTVMLIDMPRFSVAKLLLHHYRSNLAHISDFDSLVIGLSKFERWAKKN